MLHQHERSCISSIVLPAAPRAAANAPYRHRNRIRQRVCSVPL